MGGNRNPLDGKRRRVWIWKYLNSAVEDPSNSDPVFEDPVDL